MNQVCWKIAGYAKPSLHVRGADGRWVHYRAYPGAAQDKPNMTPGFAAFLAFRDRGFALVKWCPETKSYVLVAA